MKEMFQTSVRVTMHSLVVLFKSMHAHKKGKRQKGWSRLFRTLLFLAGTCFFIGSGGVFLWAATLTTPDLSVFAGRRISQSTKIYDRTGEIVLYDLHENIQRTLIPFENISRHIKNATVAIEDTEFYQHKGVRPIAFLRAALVNIMRLEFSQGGSTITQQVIKKAVLVDEKTIARKIKEWVLAVKLEQAYSKDEILGFYLNEVPYGGTLYGVEEASQAYFGKSASDVTLGEAAYLAALPQAPSYYSPYGNNREALVERKNTVLKRMVDMDFISEEEYMNATNEEVVFLPRGDRGIKAPHFVFYVRDYLEKKYGERAIEERGFRVITTLDYRLQSIAQEIVSRHAKENAEKFNATNAALTAIDPKTGQILVMVGSRDYFDTEIDGAYNIALAKRQPGSAFKPFVYAEALRKGYTSETVVFDVPTQFSTACTPEDTRDTDPCYYPSNYDSIFRGPVTLRNALAQSINIPAVKVLYLAGIADSIRLAKSMGISTLSDMSRYGLTLVLGGGEVTLLDITSAYGVFATEGIRFEPVSILRIEDSSGEVIEEYQGRGTRVLESDIARSISDILSDNAARTPAFGERSYLYFPGRDIAAKTGTTNEYKDAWVVGYTPSITVGAWAGNNDNSSMEKRVAGFIIAPLWHEFMEAALPTFPEEVFGSPPIIPFDIKAVFRGIWQGSDGYILDKTTGVRATEKTLAENRVEIFGGGVHSILHWVDRNNPRGPKPERPDEDSQYLYWEYGVSRWKEQQGIIDLPSPIPIP